MKTKFKSLYNSLAQIPVWYLRNNLLPILKNPNSKLLFSGAICNKGYIWPMVAALPEVERKSFQGHHLAIVEELEDTWFNITHKLFNSCLPGYLPELRTAGRNGTLSVVQEIIYDKERERQNVK